MLFSNGPIIIPEHISLRNTARTKGQHRVAKKYSHVVKEKKYDNIQCLFSGTYDDIFLERMKATNKSENL